MGAKTRGQVWVWLVSMAVAFVVAGAVGLMIQLPRRQEVPKARVGGGLGMQRPENNKLLAEQAQLHDPMRLFLSVGSSGLSGTPSSPSVLETGQELSRAFSGKLSYREDAAVVEFPARVPVPARPVDAIGLGDPDLPFMGMGRMDPGISALPSRAAYIEVVAADTGETVAAVTGPVREAKVPGANDWQPLELLLVVDRAGLVAPPTVSRTSTIDGVDDFFRQYLKKGLHLGERLAPGSYIVTIGR